MRLGHLALLTLSSLAYSTPVKRYGELIRGVCLGGWFVLEPWITPSIFDKLDGRIVDEYTFGQYQDKSVAEQTINSHLESFITKDDFFQISSAGLTHVRIPFGFWGIDVSGGEPYIVGNRFEKLKQAVHWANEANLKVVIDLHGAPGSQNGLDNSGHLGSVNWYQDQNKVDRTLYYVKTLANEFTKPEYKNTVEIIELLNEPQAAAHPDMMETLKKFYQNGYNTVHATGAATMIHDGFVDINTWNNFLTSNTGAQNVYLDLHKYEVFSDSQLQKSDNDRIGEVCQYKPQLQSHSQNQHWTVVGEFSAAITDCAKYLNGRGIGARYDGSYSGSSYIGSCQGKSGSGDDWTEDYKNRVRSFWNAQIDSWEGGKGYFFWTWKTETAAEWDYQRLLNLGIIPRDPSQYNKGVCG